MMQRSFVISMILSALALSGAVSHAEDLKEDEGKQAPKGVLVQVNEANQKFTVFSVKPIDPATAKSAEAVQAFVATNAVAANVIGKVKAEDMTKKTSELDETVSQPAWYYHYFGNWWTPATYFTWYQPYTWVYPTYTYNYGYSYYYPLRYNYSWGGYGYYFFQ